MNVNADPTAALRASLETLPSDATAASADKFKALMEKPAMAPPQLAGENGVESASKVLAEQDAALQDSVDHAVDFMQRAPQMTLSELNAGSIRLTYELAAMQLDMEAKMSVVNSSKSAVETLMKNQ